MKIYCILFDTVPQDERIEKLFERKNLHYSDYITNSSTVPTVVSMFSGLTPTGIAGPGGIGHSHTFNQLTSSQKLAWDKEQVFYGLPDNWNIHIHAMPLTRGDLGLHECIEERHYHPPGLGGQYLPDGFFLVPDDICGRNKQMKFHKYNPNVDEETFLKVMQDLPADENNFIFLKYNHYHDASRGESVEYQGRRVDLEHEQVIDMFVDMIDKINFEEENSLFWLFADHGHADGVDTLMSPPNSWLAWVSVTDNITNKKVTKNKIAAVDFKNTVLNRIHNRGILGQLKTDRLSNDVLDEVDKNRIYVAEDGRGDVDPNHGTTVSAIRCLDDHRFVQFVHHSPNAPKGHHTNEKTRTIMYDNKNKFYETIETDTELLNYLRSGIWKWYFE